MRVEIGDKVLACGWGKSKKEAQQEAARQAIARIEEDCGMLESDEP
jgi:dsRNA-specific ribonuclease